jgi:predicted nucleotidyltransferase
METDNMNCYIKLEETKNVITEQIRNNGDMVGYNTH